MSLGSALETGFLGLLLNASGIANLADNTATSPLTNLYLSLHTASPGVTGNQSTSEISYTGYARVAVVRQTGSPGWTIAGSNPATATLNSTATFGTMTAGAGGTVTYAVLGSASGVGTSGVLYGFGAVSPNITVTSGVAPVITTGTTFTMT